MRDRWGVPHIYARTERDLFFANGIVHAEDRLWQMELQRRAAQGRLSEIFGPVTLDTDRFLRRVGLARAVVGEMDLLDPPTRLMVEAYAAGVSWIIDSRPLPLEFTLLRHRPEPWSPLDSLAWGRLMGWGLSVNWATELVRVRLAARLGPELAAELEPLYPAGGWLTAGGPALSRAADQILTSYQRVQELTGLGEIGGSNAWAIRPSRSESGGALLANDTHLAPQLPSVWYELGLDATDVNGSGIRAIGASLPGLPGIQIGHNGRIAWGVTASLVDTQDLFVERQDPTNPLRFARGDDWEEARLIREEIRVRGRRRWHVEEVAVSSNGPVITPFVDGATAPISLRAIGLEPGRTAIGVRRLLDASNWGEFRSALADWVTPAVTFVYSDASGNVGYQAAGTAPRRGAGDGTVPAPGWDPAYAWQGYLGVDDLPHGLNPAEGFVATANNQLVDDEFPFALGRDWADAYRVNRIVDLLRSRPIHTRESCAEIQLDVVSLAAREIVTRLRGILGDEQPIEPLERECLRLLLEWDGGVAAESVPAAIYELLRSRLLRILYGPSLGDVLNLYLGAPAGQFAAGSSFGWRASSRLIAVLDDPDWPRRCGHVGITWRDLLLIALGEAVADLRLRFGEEIGAWRWGRLHSLTFEHPLARFPVFRMFNRGPLEVGGDTDTARQNGTRAGADARVTWAPVYRQIIDFGNLGESLAIHTTGQSGQPFSPHYDDLIPLWHRGLYHPMLWERAEVEAHLAEETRLLPSDERWP